MKNFILKVSMFSLIVLSLLISVNYWGDGAKLFQSGYENKIANIIFSNHNATNISNFDERNLQRELIDRIESRPDVTILGSSRTMLINSTFFKQKKVINNSVSGASIQDFIAIYQLYKNKKLLPRKIILGIDPWLFNEKNGQKRWRSLSKEYYQFVNYNKEPEESITKIKFKQLFSVSYFKASLRNLIKVISGKSEPIPTKKVYNKRATKLVDASLSYGEKSRGISNEEANNKAKTYISGDIYSIESFNIISPKILKEFEDLCQSILQNEIELSFFLAPYHPLVYQKIEQNYPMVFQTENKILEFAKKHNIKLLGSFNPINSDVNSQGFHDGMHSKESTIKKIMGAPMNNNVYKSLGNW